MIEYVNVQLVAPDVLRVFATAADRPTRQVTLCRQPGEGDVAFCKRAELEAQHLQNYFYGVSNVIATARIHCLYDVAPDPSQFDDMRDDALHIFWWLAQSSRVPLKASLIAVQVLRNAYGWANGPVVPSRVPMPQPPRALPLTCAPQQVH